MLCVKTKIFHSITILTLLLFNHIQCNTEKNQDSQPPGQNPKIIDELIQESETKKAIVNVLIGINCFLFIMILFIVIYEIIKYRQRKKMKDILLFSLQKKNITNKENSSNRKSNIEYSSIIKNTKNSFNSSKMMESPNSNNISNNNNQKPFLNESNNSYRERSDSGYEAPVVQNYEKKKEEKIFTNDGGQRENDNRKFKNVCNSELNENKFFTNKGNENKNEDKLFINDINGNKKASLLENPF